MVTTETMTDSGRRKNGVVYIALGLNATREATESIRTLRRWHDWPIMVIGDRIGGTLHAEDPGPDSIGRGAKTKLDLLSPWQHTLYLDADTRVHGDISAGFDILRDGWDVAMTHSQCQGNQVMWHLDEAERNATIAEVGHHALQLAGGMMFFRKSARVRRLFTTWRKEWARWQGQDQGALLRSLYRVPVRLWLLGRPWNGGVDGALIEHRYGAARRR